MKQSLNRADKRDHSVEINRMFAGFSWIPCGIESIEVWNRFWRNWKSFEFGQNAYKVL